MTPIAPLKILKASAGSGKTFSLTIHYLALLFANENNYREILAVTFTNKATAEMKERILEVLHGLAIGSTNSKINAFRDILRKKYPDLSTQDLQHKAFEIYRRILHDYGNFTVSTIDGFSQKVIRSFSYELNLDAAYKIELNTDKVKKDLTIMLNQLLDSRPELLEWIMEHAEKKIDTNENWNYRKQLMELSSLIFTENFQEFDGILNSKNTHEVFNLLNTEISLKTETFLLQIEEAVKNFQQIFQKSAVTADDLFGKSRNKLISASKVSSDIFKLSVRDLKEKIFDRFLRLIDDQDTFKDRDKSVRHDLIAIFQPSTARFAELWDAFPSYVSYRAVQQNIYYLRLLKEMSGLLHTWRKENSAQLISDSQILLNKLGLDTNNDPTFIWEKIGNRYNYFLFDEFQDTSRIQWQNYSPLLINALSLANGKINEHLIVGDVKQSIYRWRNGDWRILLQQVEQQISQAFHLNDEQKKEFIDVGSLDTNYRSLPNIIQFNNHIYKEIPLILQKTLNEKVFNELNKKEDQNWWLESGNANMLIKAYAESEQKVPESKIGDSKPSGEIDIHYLPVANGRFRNLGIADEILEKLCNQVGEWINSGKYQANQIGILVRRNKEIQMVVEALMAYKNDTGAQFNVVSGSALSLAANNAILLLIETLKSIVYNSEKHSIYKANMAYLYQNIKHKTAFAEDIWLQFKNNDINTLQEVLPTALITAWENWHKLPLVHLIEKLIEVFELTNEGNIHIPYLLAFKDIVSKFSTGGERGIIQFLEYWEEDGNRSTLPSGAKVNAIEVLTVHKSKGLAYDVVMIPFTWPLDGSSFGDFWIDVEDSPFSSLGKIPIKYSSTLAQSLFYKQYFEEILFNYTDALNTFYVATTRAIKHIYLLAPFFKTTENKKTGNEEPEIKNEFITDILYQALHHTGPYVLEDKEYHLKDKNFIPGLDQDEQIANTITLTKYPISAELDQAFRKSSKRSLATILTVEKAAQYGIMAHEILSEVSKEEDIMRLVEQYIERGILAKDDREELLLQIYKVWHNPQIKAWLDGGFKIWNEASIITSTGETIRPDKVFTSDTETIVLDFKFTQDDYVGHKTQVDKYKKALENLGYNNVKGFLFYAKSNLLQEVI